MVIDFPTEGILLGRVWNPRCGGPSICTLRDGRLIDITTRRVPTVADVCALEDPAGYVSGTPGIDLGTLAEVACGVPGDPSRLHFLAPCDLQVVKACGVTFVGSMIERVIEERAGGDPTKADAIRCRISDAIGTTLHTIVPGSEAAVRAKATLIAEGLWSQYLEVGIGPDAEVFTKAPVLSAVGYGAEIGIHPASHWNNPEPEVVLVIAPSGWIVGATLGNDVNLRDVEGRSALLLGRAKDNNASCAIGPMIRLFDPGFALNNIRQLELDLTVTGPDGFTMKGRSSMSEISRDPLDLVAQTIGRHHQYPDGLMLFLGTLFAPTQDREIEGEGFTHKIGDVVSISAAGLGTLRNTVQLSTECTEWRFGMRALMTNLANRDLL